MLIARFSSSGGDGGDDGVGASQRSVDLDDKHDDGGDDDDFVPVELCQPRRQSWHRRHSRLPPR